MPKILDDLTEEKPKHEVSQFGVVCTEQRLSRDLLMFLPRAAQSSKDPFDSACTVVENQLWKGVRPQPLPGRPLQWENGAFVSHPG